KEALEKLPSVIPQIKYYEVGINELKDPRAYDLVIISEFKDNEDFEIYKNHTTHRKTLSFIMDRAEDAKVVDYFV
ncbi:MAG: Dabb family protein, partial [Candidatus Kapaibacteriota bacterium]